MQGLSSWGIDERTVHLQPLAGNGLPPHTTPGADDMVGSACNGLTRWPASTMQPDLKIICLLQIPSHKLHAHSAQQPDFAAVCSRGHEQQNGRTPCPTVTHQPWTGSQLLTNCDCLMISFTRDCIQL